jgi:hypothetical protein
MAGTGVLTRGLGIRRGYEKARREPDYPVGLLTTAAQILGCGIAPRHHGFDVFTSKRVI